MKPTLRHRVEYRAGRVALFFVNLLPERPAYWLCGALGRLYYRCSKRRQRLSMHILRNAYPDRDDAELRRLAVRAAGNVFKVVLDTVRVIPVLARGRFRERVDLGALERLAPAPPFVAVSGHLGSWEIGAISIAVAAGESHVIARMFKNPLLNAFILRNRRAAGLHIHPKRGGVRGLTRAVREGRVGVQASDQNQRLRGVFVPFFGQLASTDRSAATLALRCDVPILVGCAHRIGAGLRFAVDVHEPFRPEPSGDHEADIARVTLEINRRLEVLIRRYPDQYLWMHDRYRTRPPDQPAA